MAARAVSRYSAPLSSTAQPSALATRWATVPLPDAVGPSMVMTGAREVTLESVRVMEKERAAARERYADTRPAKTSK